MRKVIAVIGLLVIAGCHKRNEDCPSAQAQPVITQPPTAPTCGTHLFSQHGEFTQNDARLSRTNIFIPGLQSVGVSYKQAMPYVDAWIPLVEGSHHEALEYLVSGSTVTIVYAHYGWWEWELSAVVDECRL